MPNTVTKGAGIFEKIIVRTLQVLGTMSVSGTFTADSFSTGDEVFTYNEGTWTPAVSGTGTVPTFTSRLGTFTRIGRLCFFNVDIDNVTGGTAGSGSTQLSISLPFPTSADQLPIRVQGGQSLNGTNEENVFISFTPSSSTALLWRSKLVGQDVEIVSLTNDDLNNANIRELHIMSKLLI